MEQDDEEGEERGWVDLARYRCIAVCISLAFINVLFDCNPRDCRLDTIVIEA